MSHTTNSEVYIIYNRFNWFITPKVILAQHYSIQICQQLNYIVQTLCSSLPYTVALNILYSIILILPDDLGKLYISD